MVRAELWDSGTSVLLSTAFVPDYSARKSEKSGKTQMKLNSRNSNQEQSNSGTALPYATRAGSHPKAALLW